MTQKPASVSYPVGYNKGVGGGGSERPVVAAAAALLSCGHVALKAHKRLMSSLITLQ